MYESETAGVRGRGGEGVSSGKADWFPERGTIFVCFLRQKMLERIPCRDNCLSKEMEERVLESLGLVH